LPMLQAGPTSDGMAAWPLKPTARARSALAVFHGDATWAKTVSAPVMSARGTPPAAKVTKVVAPARPVKGVCCRLSYTSLAVAPVLHGAKPVVAPTAFRKLATPVLRVA